MTTMNKITFNLPWHQWILDTIFLMVGDCPVQRLKCLKTIKNKEKKMNYPQLEEKYNEYLDEYSLDDIDDEFIEQLIYTLGGIPNDDTGELYDDIISDLFLLNRLNRQRKLEKLRSAGFNFGWCIPRKLNK